MPAKYVYKEQISERPYTKWTVADIVQFVRMWDRGEATREIAKYFKTTQVNIRSRASLIRNMGIELKGRSNKNGAIDK